MKILIAPIPLLFITLLSGCTSSSSLTSTSWLASAAIAAVVSAIVSGFVAIIIKDKEYKNDYFKKVIDKRIKALEALEVCTALFSSYYGTTKGENLYHTILNDDEGAALFNEAVDELKKYGIWYSKRTAGNILLFSSLTSSTIMQCIGKSADARRKIAVDTFAYIEHHRAILEECIRNDMASLHKVEEFFNSMASS